MTPKYPEIEVQLSGEDGNAMMIIGRVSGAMRRGGASKDDISAFTDDAMSGDYDNVIRAAMRAVSVR